MDDHIGNMITLIETDPEKDNPHGHPGTFTLPDPKKPERRRNIFCNLLSAELYNMHVELAKGNSSQDSAGFTPPDVAMLREKLESCKQYLKKGSEAKPELHFIESVRGDSDDGNRT